MSHKMKLEDAYSTMERMMSVKNTAISYYYDILYKISTTVFKKRMASSMNQTEFADSLNVSQAMVSKYESGDYNFTIKQICKLCEKLDLSVELSLSPANEKNNNIAYTADSGEVPIDYKALGEAA